MMQKTFNGLGIVDVAVKANEAYAIATDGEPTYEEDRWEAVAAKAIWLMDPREGREVEVSAKDAAAALYQSYMGAPSEDYALFFQQPKPVKVAWEAVARFLFDLLTSDVPTSVTYELVRPWVESQLGDLHELENASR